MNVAVILAGGTGSRYGGELPKQYCLLQGREVISYAIDAAKSCQAVDCVLVVCDSTYRERISSEYGVDVCSGGSTRNHSVWNAIRWIEEHRKDCEKVIFLDSARPLVRPELLEKYLKQLDDDDCVITGQKIVDSLGSSENRYEDRDKYFLIQTPEACRFAKLKESFDPESERTAICQLMPPDSTLFVSYEMKHNMKITYQGDLERILPFLEARSEK